MAFRIELTSPKNASVAPQGTNVFVSLRGAERVAAAAAAT